MKRYDFYSTCGCRTVKDEWHDGNSVDYEDAARVLAQRDRLAELLRRLRSKYGSAMYMHLEMADILDDVHEIFTELDKEKQS